ncbi:6474_t:CDS:1, partial [Dentiscutata heterogama]
NNPNILRINKIKKLSQDDEALDSSQSSQSTDIRVNELEWSKAITLAEQ